MRVSQHLLNSYSNAYSECSLQFIIDLESNFEELDDSDDLFVAAKAFFRTYSPDDDKYWIMNICKLNFYTIFSFFLIDLLLMT